MLMQHAILCNNYGNNLILLSQVSLVFRSCSAGVPRPPPAEPSPWVHERAVNVGGQPLHPTTLSLVELPALPDHTPLLTLNHPHPAILERCPSDPQDLPDLIGL